MTIDDPKTCSKPFTMALLITASPDYEVSEYACHKGKLRDAAHSERSERGREGKEVDDARVREQVR